MTRSATQKAKKAGARGLTALAALLACALLALSAAQASAAVRLQSGSFGTDGTAATRFGDPYQLAFNQAADRLFVLDHSPSRIHAFNAPALTLPGGNFPLSVGATGFFGGVAVDNTSLGSAGRIYYSSEAAGALAGFDSAGTALGAPFPISPPGFPALCGVAVDSAGNIAVADFNGQKVLRYSSAGAPLASIDTSAQGPPCHLAFDSNDDLFVNHFTPFGSPEKVWKYTAASAYTAATMIDPLDTRAIAVDRGAGILYAAHSNFASAYRTDGTFLYDFARGIRGADFQGITVDEGTGTVYVSDTGSASERVRVFPALTVETLSTSALTETTATLTGKVNTAAALSDCHFEYVGADAFKATGFSDLSSGGSVPCDPAAGSIAADQANHAVSAEIVRPADGAFYFRLLATSSAGSIAGLARGVGLAITGFDGEVLDELGNPATQAGSHPHTAGTEFFLSTVVSQNGEEVPTEQLQDAVVKLPPGLLGNPQVVPTCTQAQLQIGSGAGDTGCPDESQVGVVDIVGTGFFPISPTGVYRMETPSGTEASPIGTPALFGFLASGVRVMVYAKLRTGEDYGVTVISKNAPQTIPVSGAIFDFWGVPADPSHNADRFCANRQPTLKGCASSAPLKPFISLPTSCVGPVETTLEVTSWLGFSDSASFLSHDNGGTPIGADGCPSVPFDPTLEARPTTTLGDSPSGLDVDIEVPQSDAPNIPATAHLKDTTVTLPEGLVINPSGANGLDGCSLTEFGYTSTDPDGTIHTTPDAATCPDASKVATVEVETPVLDHTIKGAAYIADPFQNPFNSLLALYITFDDPQTGIVAKLAGEVTPDPNTGQLSATFEENPQLPFEHFRLHFKSGAHGALRTPAICGPHTTEATLTPWSVTGGASPSDETDTWAIEQNCSNSPGEMPHAPSFDAGTVSPIAKAHSPFVVHLRREDGSQNFSAVTLTPPQGLVAKLAGTPACSDADLASTASKTGQAEKANPSCPLASQVGTVDVAAGAGPAPYHAPAKAYLAGPYKGAPLSLAVIAPATAGPFDLGTVVVKTALHVNSKTAEITAVSDPIPSILQGIPLDIRAVDVSLDKPDFTLTGTSCNVMSVNGMLTSTLGQVANLSSRFQLAECTALGFKPQMTLSLRGGTKRGKHPALTLALMPRPGDANIASFSVAFPRSEFLENAHIRTVCTRPDFAADACPAGAIYGEASVTTPLLDYPLTGHLYLRSSDNLLPDIVPDLRGPAYQPIRFEAAGRTDSIKGGIRNTLDFVPDAPFTKAVVALQGGSKGLLVNSRNICDRIYRATVKYTAHNGKTFTAHPALRAKCGRKARKRRRHNSHRGR
jgi:hypothetical protein